MPSYQAERAKILELIESGAISAEQGIQLLRAISGSASGEPARSEDPAQRIETGAGPLPAGWRELEARDRIQPETLDKWRAWWRIPFLIGSGSALIFAATAIIIHAVQGRNVWFYLSWVPVVAGSSLALLAFLSRQARWIHIRIRENKAGEKTRLSFSFPLPLRLTAWLLRQLGRFIPQMNKTGVDELILALGKTATPDSPLQIQVAGSGDDEEVLVYIG